MCGIAGIVAAEPLSADDRQRLPRMRDVIAHRGPDDAGLYVDERAALGHRRLSIVDLAAGHQPLANEDGSVWIVFNGEIYNHADVRPRARERRPPSTAPAPTPKPSSTPTSSGATAASSTSAACSRSRSGTRRAGDCCSRAIGSA